MFNNDETMLPEVTPETSAPETSAPEAVSTPSASTDDRRGGGRGDRGGRDNNRKGGGRGGRRDGMREEEKEFREEMLGIARVTRVTAGGRQMRFRAAIVIGDGKGRVGLGTGKSAETSAAVEKAGRSARKALVTFPIVNGTIPHQVVVKFQATKLMIHPARPGTGIIAGGAARKVFAAAGLKDIISKRHGSRNDLTTAAAAIKALSLLKPVKSPTTPVVADVAAPEKSAGSAKKSA